jgi:hypothetical protein
MRNKEAWDRWRKWRADWLDYVKQVEHDAKEKEVGQYRPPSLHSIHVSLRRRQALTAVQSAARKTTERVAGSMVCTVQEDDQ